MRNSSSLAKVICLSNMKIWYHLLEISWIPSNQMSVSSIQARSGSKRTIKSFQNISTKFNFLVLSALSWRCDVQNLWSNYPHSLVCVCVCVCPVFEIFLVKELCVQEPEVESWGKCLLFLSYADAAECRCRRLFVVWTQLSVFKPDRCLVSNLHIQQNNIGASPTSCRCDFCPFVFVWSFLLQDKSVDRRRMVLLLDIWSDFYVQVYWIRCLRLS